ncbi:MAG TPA: carbonic anhydrase [Caulobacteraceae bacterium]|jgi:carbonic anhydrase|nr:carbonic anhydrase [Caulobacteraceae bacterium]
MLEDLKARNLAWSQAKRRADPDFFSRLARQQSPRFLWIGCSDSRVPATEIVDLDPGEMFVHRNVANLAPPQDVNYLSVLQFAVEVLKVRHVLVVGHYGCGGVRAALDDHRHGLIDHWLHPIREIAEAHQIELAALEGPAREDRLTELNVRRQVLNIASDLIVRDAWARGQDLAVHGWVYALADGQVRDLDVSITSEAEYAAVRDGQRRPAGAEGQARRARRTSSA